MTDIGDIFVMVGADGWSTRQRSNSTGLLEADPKKFPSGLPALVDYVHSKGEAYLTTCSCLHCNQHPACAVFTLHGFAPWVLKYIWMQG